LFTEDAQFDVSVVRADVVDSAADVPSLIGLLQRAERGSTSVPVSCHLTRRDQLHTSHLTHTSTSTSAVTPLNAEVQKRQKLFFFANRGRHNKPIYLACKRIPRVCYSTSHLALIGKRGSVQEPPPSLN